MQHIRDLRRIHLTDTALTIGSFDGVHLGHQALVAAMVASARDAGRTAVVLTFYPHPSVVLRGQRPAFYISTVEEKARLLGDLGVDVVVTHPFDLEFSKLSANQFLDLLEGHLSPAELWIGENFAFGHQREGNRAYLARVAPERGFDLHVHLPVIVGGEVVSSTRVREALRAGDVARAATYLGRAFRLSGEVVSGAGRGEDLGFRTANLSVWRERAIPGVGVYACMAEIDGERWPAVTNIGTRPTFEEDLDLPVVEAHILDFQGDLYGDEIELTFVRRLREERRFSGPEALVRQIRQDVERARRILGEWEEGRDG
jgi:riboflavin kinase/FMN adenylyltransferase